MDVAQCMKSRIVMPAKAGIHLSLRCKAKESLDSSLRRNDDREESTFSRRIQTPRFKVEGYSLGYGRVG